MADAQVERIGRFGSFVLDTAARTLTWSDGLYRLHAVTRDDYPDPMADPLRCVHADDHAVVRDFFAVVRAGGETLECEYRVAGCDGVERWLVTRAEPAQDNPDRVLGTVHDVTDRRRAEQQRDREAARLEAAIAVQRDVTAAATDRDATLQMVAERADALFPTADGAVVELLDGDYFRYVTATGTMTPYVGTVVAARGSLSGLTAASRTVQRCDDPATDPRVDAATSARLGIGSMLIAPLSDGDRVIGVLKVTSAVTGAFDDDDRRQLELLAGALGSALRQAEDYTDNLRLLAERTSALTALTESEERFRSAFANAPLGVFITNLREEGRGRLLRVNPAACAMLGYTEEELLQRTFAGISHPDDTARDYAAIPRLISGEWTTYQTQKRYLHRDGHVVWAELHSAVVRDAAGEVVSVVTQVRDITEERAAADRLRQQAELLDLTQDAIIVRDLDSRVIFWNGGAEATYGWSAAHASGHVTHRLLHTVPVGGGDMSDVDRILLTEGRWDGELIHVRADGTSITVSSRHALRRDPDGTPTAILEINTDITARVAAERALADREARFRTQFELAPIAQAVGRLDGTITEVNDAYCALTGRSREALIGTNYRDSVHPEELADELAHLANLFAGEYSSYQHDKRMVRPDGGIVEVNSHISLIRDAQGRPQSVVAQLKDITERRQAERDRDAAAAELAERNAQLERSNGDLKAANQLKLDLMGMLSHEIGTPLTAILGHAEIVEDLADPPERVHRSLAAIRRNCELLAAMRTEILTMCALDTAELTADRERVPLADAITQALLAVESEVPVTGAEGLTALVSPSHLQHILINFLTNAAKYAGGASAVQVTGDDVNVDIRVLDDGPGVPEELREHLFERFTRGSDSRTRAHGTGLGLYIVRGLAEANSGQVWHEPGCPRGSAFTLRLARAAG
jgi:PAS domain S-box-containing protein